MYCASMALRLFGSLHVLHWHGTELDWEPSCVAQSQFGSFTPFVWHWDYLGAIMCCIGMALS